MRRKILLNESQLIQLSEAMSETTGYHGGKTKFDRFSNSFAHSGEGASTQGFGVYITLDKDNVAYYYATYEQIVERRHSTLYVNGIPMKGSMEGGCVGDFRPDYPNRNGYNEYEGVKLTQSEQETIYNLLVSFSENEKTNGHKATTEQLTSYIKKMSDIVEKLRQEIINKIHDMPENKFSHVFNENNTQWIDTNIQFFLRDALDGSDISLYEIQTWQELLPTLLRFKNDDVFELPSNKHFEQYLYTVDVPDVNKKNYLDWDSKIDDEITWDDEFIDSYREFIKENGYFNPKKFFGYFGDDLTQPNTVKNLYDYITEMFYDGDEEKTSNYFVSHGKKGHYYDSHYDNCNLVVYDADDVKIINIEKI